jgi:hypothetical protein
MIMTINTDGVKNILEQEFFLSKWNKAFHFLPTEFFDWAIQSNLQISEHKIDKWDAFEYGHIDFEENDFRELMFKNEDSPSTEVLFISTESLIKGKAFSFKLSEYYEFVTYYENMFKMSLFQPDDYIVYLRELKEIRIIHHDGKLLEINTSRRT